MLLVTPPTEKSIGWSWIVREGTTESGAVSAPQPKSPFGTPFSIHPRLTADGQNSTFLLILVLSAIPLTIGFTLCSMDGSPSLIWRCAQFFCELGGFQCELRCSVLWRPRLCWPITRSRRNTIAPSR